MNPITQLFSDHLIQALGWTLLHSLWQGAVFAILLALMFILMRRFTSNTRYLVSVILLGLFFASTLLTFSVYYKTAGPSYEPTKKSFSMGLQQYEGSQPDYEGGPFAFEQAWEDTNESETAGILAFFSNYFQQNIPLIVMLWLLGVLVLLLKFLGGLAMVQRIKHYKSDLLPEYWRFKAEELSRQMKIRQRIVFLRSRIADSPLVIGFFKPAVIMPARVLTGLNEEQIEAILVHELAHIKRHDYPVNILQSLVEILFFFNPSVWWMSNTVRHERENCCDDIALSVTGEAYDYASALIQLEEQRRHTNAQAALAFVGNQHSFTQRIKRLFNQPTLLADFKEGFVTAMVLFAGLFLMAMYVWDTPKIFGDQKRERKVDIGAFFEGEEGLFNADEVVIENLEEGSFRVILEPDRMGKIDNDGLKALLDAISDGSLETVRFIIEKGVDVNGQTEHGWTPLLEAIDEGRLDVVKLLVDSGADVNQANKHGWTPLMESADEGQLDIAKYLIKEGADINQKDKQGRTLLLEAIDEGLLEFVKMLVDKGADVNQANKHGWTPLMEAADEGHLEIAQYLISKGADINQSGHNGRTLLMEAIDEGHYGICQNAGGKRGRCESSQ
jgi:ankyrin repeat protein/beta-lactamase regulating signal transducer with metallopeptidase domain